MGILLHVICCFPLFLLIFYLSVSFCQFDNYVSQCVPLWVYPTLDSLLFLDLVDYFLSPVMEVFSYCLFKYFLGSLSLSSPFRDPYNVNIGAFNVAPEVS